MWRPSEDSIGDLITCNLPYFANSSADVPATTNVGWWSRHGVSVPASLARNDLFDMAHIVRESGDDGQLVELLWRILAWGVMNNFRNATRIVRDAQHDGGGAHLLRTLRPAAEASFNGDIERAYQIFLDQHIDQLGAGFFTKFLYFTGDPDSARARCLILDSLASRAVEAITGNTYSYPTQARRKRVEGYGRYCRLLDRQARSHGVAPDFVEFRLYLLGRLFDNPGGWLEAEVSLYRDSITPTFDDVIQRLISLDLSCVCRGGLMGFGLAC